LATETILPDSAGDETNILFQQPGTGAHWDKMRDSSDSTYVTNGTASWNSDLYNLGAPAGSGSINSVTVWLRAKYNTTGVAARTRIKTNGVAYNGADITLTMSWANYSTTYALNPQTGKEWTWAEVAALQAGLCLQGVGTYSYASEVWVVIDYSTVVYVGVTDSGVGTDAVSIPELGWNISDTGVGTETAIAGLLLDAVQDSGVGADGLALQVETEIDDSGVFTDEVVAGLLVPVTDAGLGAEFVWRLKGCSRVDSFDLPHVLSIRITDDAAISDKKIQDGTLPRRKMVGKPGRAVEINGWTKNQADIDSMEALVDGAAHVFLHPSGDSFAVRVKDFDPDGNVDRYDRRLYRMTLVELGTW
jgi:hypothetical protein